MSALQPLHSDIALGQPRSCVAVLLMTIATQEEQRTL